MSTIDQVVTADALIHSEPKFGIAKKQLVQPGTDATPGNAVKDAPSGDFGKTMVDALQAVNAQQSKAGALSSAYERGDTNDIVQVMVERQKASIGFEATLQVRNKLLTAYRDIMNMPV